MACGGCQKRQQLLARAAATAPHNPARASEILRVVAASAARDVGKMFVARAPRAGKR